MTPTGRHMRCRTSDRMLLEQDCLQSAILDRFGRIECRGDPAVSKEDGDGRLGADLTVAA